MTESQNLGGEPLGKRISDATSVRPLFPKALRRMPPPIKPDDDQCVDHGEGAAPPAAAEPEPESGLMWTPSSNGGAAPTAAAEPEMELMWTRRHDKLLELLLWRWRMRPPWDRVAAHLGDKTPFQAFLRYLLMDIEVRIAMEAPEVETSSEWDLQETAALPSPTSEQPAPLTVTRAKDIHMQTHMMIDAQDADIQAPMVFEAENIYTPTSIVIEAEGVDTPTSMAIGAENADMQTLMVFGAEEDVDMSASMVIGAEDTDMQALMAIKGEDVDMQAHMAIGAEDVDMQALMAIKVEDVDETSNEKKCGGARKKPEI
ncbi:hypothetical protein GUJ93_ZPchr0006g43087 [Zizania palustris]|uniref:Uncharacterized protein n=1 Tax=Zizania palustris TaxID=103762 RepID=A0A8J5T707_ZIZPA|nr:hypothetical protein GUJ93_ZPchr0006g43087 [Zizania palustris]